MFAKIVQKCETGKKMAVRMAVDGLIHLKIGYEFVNGYVDSCHKQNAPPPKKVHRNV